MTVIPHAHAVPKLHLKPPPKPLHDWTPTEVAELTRLWSVEPRLTTTEIGKVLGIGKNAVVGKAHRLHLPSRPNPCPNRKYTRGGAVDPADRFIRPRAKPSIPHVTPERPAPEAIKRRTQDRPLSAHTTCRFPLWEFGARPKKDEQTFCDKPSIEGKSWCPEHFTLCTTATVKAESLVDPK